MHLDDEIKDLLKRLRVAVDLILDEVVPFGEKCEGFSHETGCPATPQSPIQGSLNRRNLNSSNLIAAAPDLLAALKRWEQFAMDNQWSDADCTFLESTRAAIAKAEGRS